MPRSPGLYRTAPGWPSDRRMPRRFTMAEVAVARAMLATGHGMTAVADYLDRQESALRTALIGLGVIDASTARSRSKYQPGLVDEAMRMRDKDGLGWQEIAERLRCDCDSIQVYVSRARKVRRLREAA